MGGGSSSSLKNVSLISVGGNNHCESSMKPLVPTKIMNGCYFHRVKVCWETGYSYALKPVAP